MEKKDNVFDGVLNEKNTFSTSIKEKLKVIEKIDNIPAMPAIVVNVISKLNDPDAKNKELEELISLDPVLVSFILKIVNSPIYGTRSEVLTISKALFILGMKNIKTLMMGYGAQIMLQTLQDKNIQHYLWQHSISVGVLAKLLSEQFYEVVHSEAYVAGLLHDIGKIVLFMHDKEKFMQTLVSEKGKHKDYSGAEQDLYGFSHIETGFFLISELGFSNTMKDIILYHHYPEFAPENNSLIWIIGLADEISFYMEEKIDEDILFDNIDLHIKKLKLSKEQIQDVIAASIEEIKSYISLMKI